MSNFINNPLAILRREGTNEWKVVSSADNARGISADRVIFLRNTPKDFPVVRECTAGVKEKLIIEVY